MARNDSNIAKDAHTLRCGMPRKSKLLAVYEALTSDIVTDDDPRRPAIMAEMRAVLDKRLPPEKAATVIEWWWKNDPDSAMKPVDFVVMARMVAEEMRKR